MLMINEASSRVGDCPTVIATCLASLAQWYTTLSMNAFFH